MSIFFDIMLSDTIDTVMRIPLKNKLTYSVEMAKEGKKILWHVLEEPTNNVVGKYFFEEDANELADFQNKHRVWQENGGIPKFLWNY